jgi:DNA-binding PadR family transcriptional regulator
MKPSRNPETLYAQNAYSLLMTMKKAEKHLPLRPVEFLILATLLDAPRHGYAMVREVERQTGGRVRLRPGDLYRVLARMESRGFLDVAERRPAEDAPDERRTYYQLTVLGREVARAEAEVMAGVSSNVLAKTAREVSA